MAKVKFYKLNSSTLNSLAIAEGQLIFVQDTGKLYIDKDDSNRVQVEGPDLIAGLGIAIGADGTTITNTGVRSVATGSTQGTISVNTNGTTEDVSVNGLGSMAYKSAVAASDITSGTIGVNRGGTGVSILTSGEVLVGNGTSNVTTKAIDTTTGGTISSNSLITSGAVKAGLNLKLDTSLKGANNGLAELGSDGKVLSTQLPSYVDDVLEYASKSNFPGTGESGKIYIALDTNKTYRWSGSAYVEISESLALGETSSTAYRGDRGKVAYDHASDSNKISSAIQNGFYKIAGTADGHIAGLTNVTKKDITDLEIPGTASKGIQIVGTDIELTDEYYDLLYGNSTIKGEGNNIGLNGTIETQLKSITPIGACEQDSYSGKNQLSPTDNFTDTSGGVTISGNDGIYVFTGSNVTSAKLINKAITTPYEIKENDYLHVKNDVANINCTFNLGFSDNTFTNLSSFNVADKKFNLNDFVGKTITKIRLYTGANYDGTTITMKSMILNNISIDSEWEKFVGGIPSPNPSYPQDVRVVTGDNEVVVQNKNILPINLEEIKTMNTIGTWSGNKYTLNDLEFDIDLENGIKINGTSSAGTQFNVVYPFKLLSGQYFYSGNGSNTNVNNWLRTGSTTFRDIGSGVLVNNTETKNFYAYITIENATTLTDYIIKPQLEIGSSATTYVPHAEQKVTLHLGSEYLAGIGDYRDEIVGKTDDWKIKRYVGKVNYDGSNDENWGNVSVLGDYYRIAINITGIKNITNNNDYQGLSNRFIKDTSVVTNINPFSGAMCQFRNTSTVYFCISQTTLADFRTWLASNNVILYYVLETPTEETITDQTLISDLNNMYNLMGYDGQTNITITSNSANAQMIASVEAFDDTLINIINNKENSSNKVTSISASSTDDQYPSAKCVYDIVGDINSALDLINGEVI